MLRKKIRQLIAKILLGIVLVTGILAAPLRVRAAGPNLGLDPTKTLIGAGVTVFEIVSIHRHLSGMMKENISLQDVQKEIQDFIERGKVETHVPKTIEHPVEKPKTELPQRVIGHYPEYIELGKELGVKPFSIPEKIWNQMTPQQQWEANKKYLDRAIEKNSEFNIATSIDKIRPGSWLEKEIKYLIDKGYEFNKNYTKLIPPKNK